MTRKKLWLIVLTVVLCLSFSIGLAACGGSCGEDKSYESTTSLQIANKAELQAEWFEDGEDRTVRFILPPELSENDVRVTSNNPAVVLAEGKTLKAAGVGIAKITVFADDESDSVNITVKQALREISITNKSELRKIVVNEERTVQFSAKPDAFDIANANVEITSGNAGVVSVDGKVIKAVGVGETTLTVKVGKYSDSVDISVINLSNPSFGIGDGDHVKGAVNSAIELPFAVLSCDGTDLRGYVEAVCDAGLTFDKTSMTVSVGSVGEYSVKMSVADPRNAEMTASVEFKVNAYRKLFADYNGYGNIGYEIYEDGKQFVADEEQVASFDRWDATFASFDMQPSKTYYAEFVIDSASKADWLTFYGMTHSVKGDATRFLTAYVDRGAAVTREPEEGEESRYYSGARDFRIKDIDILNDMDCWQLHQGNGPRTQILYTYGLNRYRGIDKAEPFPCKLATARIGDFFYYFVNDDYVCAATSKYLQGKDSVPGYFQQSGIKTDIKNIVWLTGTDAEAKFNALTDNGSKMFGEYAPNDWWKTENEASGHISHTTEGNTGANYTFDSDALTGENKGIVTPYIFFDGDFTFEWEYRFDADSAAGNWDRFMALEVRHLRDEKDRLGSNYSDKYAFLFGSSWQKNGDNDLCAMVKCFSKEKPNDWDWEHPQMADGGKEWYTNSQKLKYSVTRICKENGEGKPFARYTFVIQRADGSERSVWTYDDYGLDKWNSPCEPVILLWKNKGVKGTYSNVRWSIPEDGVTINNKEALQNKWTVGDADRTVAVGLSGKLEGPATVTSSNDAVVSVNGYKLTAVGGGTATVTVTVGSFTDSVTITVTPALESVSISNKSALTAKWKLSDGGTRDVEVAFSPAEHYNAGNTQVTITSSNTDVITVDGSTLTAVGAGRTTITVSVGELKDTAVIIITTDKPVLSLESSSDIYGEAGSEIALPAYTVISVEGEEVASPAVSITCNDTHATVTDGKLTATESGEYTVTYSFAGADSVTTTVYVYRKAISSVYAEGDEVTVGYNKDHDCIDDEKQTITLDTKKNTYAQFNMAATEMFYAEATFVVAAQGVNDNYYGLYVADPAVTTRYLAVMTDRGNDKNNEWFRAVKVVDFDTTKDNWTGVSSTKYWTRNVFNYGRQITEKAEGSVTVAIACVDGMFYMFIDDQLIMGFTAKDYSGKDLIVGLFQKNAVEGTQITAMNYLSDGEALLKLSTLTDNGGKLIDEYKPDPYWAGVNVAGGHIESSTEAGKGINFTFKDADQSANASAVTPNLYFDGNFTFEWEFKFAEGTTGGTGNDWSKFMRVELRNYDYSDWGLSLTATAKWDGGNNLCIGANANRDANSDLSGFWLNEGAYAYRYKFSISRVCNAAGNANYRFRAWYYQGSNYVPVYDRYFLGTELNSFGAPDAPAIIVMKTSNVAGEYTNINWTTSEKWTVPNYSFDISDKTELTKKWVAGSEEERSVNISASRDLFGYYTVTSSDPEVISVEGNKLKALKGGTATITVTFGNLTDSVTITVTPALESISIANKGALTAEWKLSTGGTRNVEVAYAPSDIYNADNTSVTVTSSNTNVLTVDGNTLTAVGAGRTTITVSVGELKDTAVIIITTDKPVLSLESSSDIYGEAGSEIALPGYTVISIEGDEVESPAVSVTCDNATVTDGKLTATEPGEYTVTYSYTGADSVTTTVYVYRKAIVSIFAEGDEVKAQYTQNADCIDSAKQTVTLNTKKNTYAQFNMAAGSNFYAEATFVVAAQGGNDNYYGIYAADPTVTTRYLAAMTDRGDKEKDWHRAVKIVDFDTTKNNWTDVRLTKFYCDNVFKYGRQIKETVLDRVTVALARIDDVFYMFINGNPITGFTAKDYNGKNLVVGLFQKNAVDGTQITAMNYLSGDAAVNKFNTLTGNGSKFLGEYRYNDWWDSVNSASDHMTSSDDASKGANYTFNGTVADENAGIVTPYVSFDGDFTFEWEFKFAAGTTGGNWNKFMRVEVRTAEYSDWGLRFTATAQENGGNNLCIGANVSRNEHSDLSGVWLKDEGYASLYKFSISRVCNAEGNANYRFKAWKKSGGEYELVYERYLIGTQFNSFGAPDTPAIIVIKTVNVAGEYTNIKCSIPEKWSLPDSQVEIINKSDLTQRWIEGGGNRNVAVTVNPDWFGYYTITSSDSEVISVEGNTLRALAAGTATVTLTAGNKTDSVEITVIPVLSGVSISNKSALSAAWKLSDGGTRSVDVAYSPAEHYNADNTDVTITSSNTGVLTVDGKTLTPVGIGRTTITVSAGGKSDTVEVTVAGEKPALSLESSSDIYGEAGSEIALPGYTVISVEGDEVENPAVSVTCDNATVTDGKLTATEPGEYTVTYSYAGADSVTTTVYVYRKAIASVFAEGDDVEAQYTQNPDCIDNEKQTVTFNTKKNTYAQFNMSAGSNFYAEATFVVAAQGGNDNYYGLYAADPTVTTRYLAVMNDRGVKANEWERAVKVVDFDTTKNNWTDVSSTKYWCRNVFNYGRQITEKAEGSVTVALAYIDDTFYMFIDDQLITCFTAKDYSGKDLVVGLFQKNAVDGTDITAMNYLSGNDAQTKLNAMTDNGNKLISGYRPNGDWVNNNTANGHIESSTEANKGINFTFKDAMQGEDASAVTPNVYLDGDFTFEWEFKFAAGTPEGTDWNKYMRVELRNYDYSDWGFRFSASAQTLGSDNLCIGVNVNDGTDLGGYWSYDENYAGQYKFSITRKLNSSGAKSKFIFKAWKKNAGGEYELVHDKSWEDTQVGSGGNAFGDVTQPVIVVIKSRNVAGEYTNINWSTTAAQN